MKLETIAALRERERVISAISEKNIKIKVIGYAWTY